MSISKMVMAKFYRKAEGHPERLPWHQETPPPILESAIAGRPRGGRALDVGCGAGVFSVWLAEQGMDVTGIDLYPEAIAMANARAQGHGVKVDFQVADLFTYSPPQPFDLVFDSGCLHALVGGDVASYKRQLLTWLSPGGDDVLGHWGKRHALDWRPIGPRRRSAKTIQALFAPQLTLKETHVAEFAAPLPFGPTVQGIGYWFRRERA